MGQRFSKQYYPDLPQPRRPHNELQSRPSDREERQTNHYEFKFHHEAVEPQRQDERHPRRHRGDSGNDTSIRALKDRNVNSKTASREAKSRIDKSASTQTTKRTAHGHGRKNHHRPHGDPQYDTENLLLPQDSACDASSPPPFIFNAPATRPNPTRQCPICATTRSVTRFPTHSPTSACKHDASVCRRCLRRWLAAQFETKAWNELKCPMCPSVLLYSDVREFASTDMFKRCVSISSNLHAYFNHNDYNSQTSTLKSRLTKYN